MFFPLILGAPMPIRVDLWTIRIRNNNRAVRAAKRGPHDIGTGVRCGGVINDDGATNGVSEVERRVGHDVVDGVVYTMGGGVADGEFVDENPF